jgi:putative Holliday junction resolvase
LLPALGVDAGSVRVGLAASDPTGTLASPVAVLARRDPATLWDRVRREAAARGARCLVVGLPRRLDGSEGAEAVAARALAAEAAAQTGLPVELWDERFTSAEAERALIAVGRRRQQRRQTIDAVAAALMLQSWLDRVGTTPVGTVPAATGR